MVRILRRIETFSAYFSLTGLFGFFRLLAKKGGIIMPIMYYFFRHGESVLNRDGTLIGGHTRGAMLTPEGIAQGMRAGQRVKGVHFSLGVHSDTVRTKETYALIAREAASVAEEEVNDLVLEIDMGDLTLKKRAETEHPGLEVDTAPIGPFHTPPNGESSVLKAQRMLHFLYDMTHRFEGGDHNILIVSHSYAIKCMLWGLMGFDRTFFKRISMGNTSLTKIYWNGEFFVPDCINDTAHLERN